MWLTLNLPLSQNLRPRGNVPLSQICDQTVILKGCFSNAYIWQTTSCSNLKCARFERKNIGLSKNEIINTSCHLKLFCKWLQESTYNLYQEKKSRREITCPRSGLCALMWKTRCTWDSLRWLADGSRRPRLWVSHELAAESNGFEDFDGSWT